MVQWLLEIVVIPATIPIIVASLSSTIVGLARILATFIIPITLLIRSHWIFIRASTCLGRRALHLPIVNRHYIHNFLDDWSNQQILEKFQLFAPIFPSAFEFVFVAAVTAGFVFPAGSVAFGNDFGQILVVLGRTARQPCLAH